MIYRPKQKNKAPDVLILAFFVCALVAMGFSMWHAIAGRGILQTLALVLFCLMIFVLVRYKFTQIRYAVRFRTMPKGYGSEDDDDSDGSKENERVTQGAPLKSSPVVSAPPEKLEFVVEKAQGRRGFVTECVISLTDIISCRPYPAGRAERRQVKAQTGKAGLTYKYLVNLVGAEEWIMSATTPQGKVKIVFEPSREMGEYLSAVAGYNKEKRKASKKQDGKNKNL